MTVIPAKDSYIKNYLTKEFPNNKIDTVEQETPLGTAHAVMQALPYIEEIAKEDGHVLILNGDTPFLDANTIHGAFTHHLASHNDITVITAIVGKPFGYGRIIRNTSRDFVGIIEEQDADSDVKRINEISSGTFWFKASKLRDILNQPSTKSKRTL